MELKALIKKIVPKAILNLRHSLQKKDKFVWFLSYPNWETAAENADGYDEQHILDQCKTALLKVKNGEAVYERDSMLFDEIQYSWGLLSTLLKSAIDHNLELSVLDFGGSLGSSYYQNREMLKSLKSLKWCIVEQPTFVETGKASFEDDQLKFYYSIEECLKEHKPNVLLLSSVVQYLEKPFDWINKFIALDIPYIVIDRTAFVEHDEDIACVQHVPETIYKASYPCWFFNKTKFVAHFRDSYNLVGYFDSGYTPPMELDGKNIYWEGIILKK